MARFATPGVYVKEKSSFGASGAAVPTAVPAFIGYTEKASRGNNSLLNIPTRVESLAEFEKFFGGAPHQTFTVKADGDSYALTEDQKTKYLLYNSMRLFYANGGGICYVVSVGDYSKPVNPADLTGEKTGGGLKSLLLAQEPTMLVVPDAQLLDKGDCYKVYQEMLMHCGMETKSRVSIFDVYDGHEARTYDNKDVVNAFREGVGENFLSYGAGYYPYLHTSIVSKSEVSYQNISNIDNLVKLLTKEAENRYLGGSPEPTPSSTSSSSSSTSKGNDKDKGKSTPPPPKKSDNPGPVDEKAQKKFDAAKAEINKLKDAEANSKVVDQNVKAISPMYKMILADMRAHMNLLPPSAAMAGAYCMTDNATGVHKAPANLSVSAALAPAVNISSEDQEDLNAPINGKSVNAIRTFLGRGVLVWGARTLDGNSQDWRYINVRRSMIMLEQSVKNLLERYVFEPNTPGTWVKVRASLVNFLTSMWRQGTLVGTSPTQAFDVGLGLGSTMTPNDILDGVMRISIKVAISRPAEFIEVTFEQKMQGGDAGGGDEGGE